MKVKIINTGKSITEAEKKIQNFLDQLKNADVMSLSDTGLRVTILYEEKKIAKPLTKKADTGIIRGIRTKQGSKNTTKK